MGSMWRPSGRHARVLLAPHPEQIHHLGMLVCSPAFFNLEHLPKEFAVYVARLHVVKSQVVSGRRPETPEPVSHVT